ncbi:MAG TPA: hypothetical protein VL981_07185 [Candidatus Methylacidiphilales bacterium]|nr:hypothetical protein [Candidatus Methylacidiphilales bacterium]
MKPSFKFYPGALCSALFSLLIAQSADAQIFATDSDSNTIVEYGVDGELQNSALVSGLTRADGIVASDSDIFVTYENQVGEYTT